MSRNALTTFRKGQHAARNPFYSFFYKFFSSFLRVFFSFFLHSFYRFLQFLAKPLKWLVIGVQVTQEA